MIKLLTLNTKENVTQLSHQVSELSSPLVAIMGEELWHSLTIDPTIEEISKQHLKTIKSLIKKHYRKPHTKRSLRLLEVAAYAHTTGYISSFGVKKSKKSHITY